MSEFEEVAHESAKRHGLPVQGISVRVMDLVGGDVCSHPLIGERVFVSRGPHPIWPHLQAVVWCSPDGELTVDALDPRQELPTPVVNRHENHYQRAERFKKWYVEREDK